MIPAADALQRMARAATTAEDLAFAHLTHQLTGLLNDAAAQGHTSMTFDVPVMLTGFAAYDPTTVAGRLTSALRQAGYQVLPDECPWTLNLSWAVARRWDNSNITFHKE